MKTAKRVLAVIVAVIMIVGTCAVAASAAGSLQAQIDGGATTITLTKDTYETITVDRDLTINLNGYRLLSEYGQAAIKITAGDVTVTDGQVISRFANVSSTEMIKTVFKNSPPAIRITGGSVTVDGVRIVGGMVRVPTTTDYFVPSGSAIMSYNNAAVTIKRSSLYGDYGVNNKVQGGVPGAAPEIEDALIAAYTKGVKGDEYTVAEGSEEIIAADRIAGVLNQGVHLEADEQKLIRNIFDERVIIVTKTAEKLTADLHAAKPLVTKIEGETYAEVNAPVLDYTWANTKGTDCSYKLVPESITLTDGTSVALDKVEAAYVDETCPIRYRVEFKMSDEARPYIESLTKEGLDNPLDGCLAWAGEFIEEQYTKYTGTTNNGYVDTYDELIAELGKLMKTVDEVGAIDVEIGGVSVDIHATAQYKEIRKMVYELAGKTGFKAKNTGYSFSYRQYNDIFGTTMTSDAELPQYVGTLDRVQALKDQLDGFRPFSDTSKWGDLAYWVYDTAYPELLAILDEVVEKLEYVQGRLSSDDYAPVVDALHIEAQLKLLDEGVENAKLIKDFVDDALLNGDVQATLATVERHKSEIKYYADKAVDVIEGWRDRITPENFIDGDFVTTYSTTGPIDVETITATGKLHITIAGEGKVAYSNGTLKNSVTRTDDEYVGFRSSFKLTAQPGNGYEFLFWVNNETGRILSTEVEFKMVTDIDKDIEAVFNAVDEPVAYFTNPTGDICGFSDVLMAEGDTGVNAVTSITEDIEAPRIAGYGFMGWPGADGTTIDLSSYNNTDYFNGTSSVFADMNAYYGEDGAILLVRPTTASYIITPKFSKAGGYTVTLYDNDETYTQTGNYSDVLTQKSKLSGDAYWIDAETEEIVCVNKTLRYQVIDNAKFESVPGVCPEDTVTRTRVRVEGSDVYFYVERSTNKAIKTTGTVWSVGTAQTANTTPTIGGNNCRTTLAKFTDQTGLYYLYFALAPLNGRTIYVRPYIEFADGSIYYGDVAQYPAN